MPRWLFPLVASDFAGTPGAQSTQPLPPPTPHPHGSGRSQLANPGLLEISEPHAVWLGTWLTQLGKNPLPGPSSHHCPPSPQSGPAFFLCRHDATPETHIGVHTHTQTHKMLASLPATIIGKDSLSRKTKELFIV